MSFLIDYVQDVNTKSPLAANELMRLNEKHIAKELGIVPPSEAVAQAQKTQKNKKNKKKK